MKDLSIGELDAKIVELIASKEECCNQIKQFNDQISDVQSFKFILEHNVQMGDQMIIDVNILTQLGTYRWDVVVKGFPINKGRCYIKCLIKSKNKCVPDIEKNIDPNRIISFHKYPKQKE